MEIEYCTNSEKGEIGKSCWRAWIWVETEGVIKGKAQAGMHLFLLCPLDNRKLKASEGSIAPPSIRKFHSAPSIDPKAEASRRANFKGWGIPSSRSLLWTMAQFRPGDPHPMNVCGRISSKNRYLLFERDRRGEADDLHNFRVLAIRTSLHLTVPHSPVPAWAGWRNILQAESSPLPQP